MGCVRLVNTFLLLSLAEFFVAADFLDARWSRTQEQWTTNTPNPGLTEPTKPLPRSCPSTSLIERKSSGYS
ncbi:hypothetical protein B0T22DRAFT_460335 [Podospora appendiculata]|uniref:Secreted protein n=1 Tax=Podospora appendiculata TaxID=314037 RepID=A0AAE1CCP0_9PEZI|nr:hypothetical protein B0T22DRAFT_460335 [Podospora appendiculata]